MAKAKTEFDCSILDFWFCFKCNKKLPQKTKPKSGKCSYCNSLMKKAKIVEFQHFLKINISGKEHDDERSKAETRINDLKHKIQKADIRKREVLDHCGELKSQVDMLIRILDRVTYDD